jgi:hypothetical protein
VAHVREDLLDVGARLDLVRVGAAGAADRLDDRRIAGDLDRARCARGTRTPAAATRSFMSCLSRKPRTVSTDMPGKPKCSRMRAARITSGSQFASTPSIERPRSHACTRRMTSSSSMIEGTSR